jgi:hypothetical protein
MNATDVTILRADYIFAIIFCHGKNAKLQQKTLAEAGEKKMFRPVENNCT